MAAKAANDNGHKEVEKKFKAFTTSVKGILTQAGKIIKDLRAEKASLEKAAADKDAQLEADRQANASLGTEIETSTTEITDMWKKILGGVAAVVAAGVIALLVVWSLPSKQVATSAPATPVLTQADVTQIVRDQLASTRADITTLTSKVDGIQTSVTSFVARFDAMKTALADLGGKYDALKTSADKATAAANAAATSAETADKMATAAKAAADTAAADAGNLLGNVQKLANATGQLADQVAALKAPGAAASATAPAPATPAPAAPAPTTSFDWPTDPMKRQTLVYTACAEVKDGWNAVDKTVSDHLLASFTAAQAAKYFGEGGNCQAFLALATNATNIKKQLEASANVPETAPTPPPSARPEGAAPPSGGRRAENGMLCPPLGSAKFLELNPKPQGEGWVMVENVPNQPCGGWHRKNYNLAERRR